MGGRITVFVLRWAGRVNHAEERHHTWAKAEEISSVYPLFLLSPTFPEKGMGAENSKGLAPGSPSAWPKSGRF